MSTKNWQKWLNKFDEIIVSPTPRRVRQDLMQLEYSWPYYLNETEIPSKEIIDQLLSTLVQLRQSKCHSRLVFESRFIEKLEQMMMAAVYFDKPLRKESDLFSAIDESKIPPKKESEANIEKMAAVANFAIEALAAKVPRETKPWVRKNEAFELMSTLSRRPELASYTDKAITATKTIIRDGQEQELPAAARFLDAYYANNDMHFDPETLKELLKREKKCEDEDVVRSLNCILVENRVVSELEALDRIDRLRDSY